MAIFGRVDQLHRDRYLVPGAHHRALHAKFPPDLFRLACLFIAHNRSASDDAQRKSLREVGDELFRDPVCEVFLTGIGRQIT